MRVGIIALLHESNTFIAAATTLRHFEEDLLLEGEAIRGKLAGSHHEVGGFFAGLDQAGIEAVPIFAARALPFGAITADTYRSLIDRLRAACDRAGPLDGLLVAPHGATVSEAVPDVDGHWLGLLRQRYGSKIPIVSTLDPHANLSEAMVPACDAITAYRTNPHIDQRERGQEAAGLLARTLRGEVRPTQAAAFPPLAINIEAQHTSQPPCLPLYELAEAIRRRPGVLSSSVILGFPFADVAEMGSATLVVTDNNPDLARQYADELAHYLWGHRQEFVGRFIGIESALDQAERLDGPVCLLDMGDNVGGGSPGDGTLLAHALVRRQPADAFVCLYDPESVQAAERAGIGTRIALRVGGKTDALHGPPLEAAFTVTHLGPGRWEEPQPRHGGWTSFDQGPTAVIKGDTGLVVMLTSRRMAPFSLRQVSHCGLEPKAFRFLVAKGVHAPVAAYQEACRHFVRVDTPGVTSADMRRLEYHRRRRPMFPFEPVESWD